jgi:sulfatase maturation enzyme AslB (radical SAM superfamily)
MIEFKLSYRDISFIEENGESVEIYTITLINNVFDVHHYTISDKFSIDLTIFYESIKDLFDHYVNNYVNDINKNLISDTLCHLWNSRNDMEVD